MLPQFYFKKLECPFPWENIMCEPNVTINIRMKNLLETALLYSDI